MEYSLEAAMETVATWTKANNMVAALLYVVGGLMIAGGAWLFGRWLAKKKLQA